MWRLAAFAVAVGLVVGGLTAYAQGWLSDDVGSLANSAGPWALAAFAVALTAGSTTQAAASGWLVLTSCEVGYAICTELRGDSNSTRTVMFWLCAALIAGPLLGIAAQWARTDRAEQRGLGIGVIAGVLCGEGVYGLTTVSETTSNAYWTIEIVIGLALLAAATWRWRSILTLAAAAAMTVGSGAVVLVAARQL
jgi:hypothetical protein